MKLSIITINYNNKPGLFKTIKSVIDQSFQNFEYIIIDGGSTDGSIEVIKSHQNKFAYWISEKDNGVYNAMNKGIKQAKGEYIFMLNSGDYLKDHNILESVFKHNYNHKIIYGNLVWEQNGNYLTQDYPKNVTLNFFRDSSLGHQAAFIHKTLHEHIGLYDERFKIVSDWKFFLLALCKYNITRIHIELQMSVCCRDGLSCKPENMQLIADEKNIVFKEDFPFIYPDYLLAEKNEVKLNILINNAYIKIGKRLGLIKFFI